LPADMAHFRTLTMGHPVIMGRKTYESIGVALPGRRNIVVTARTSLGNDELILARSVHEALTKAEEFGPEAMIIGGAEVYGATLPLAERIYLTEVHEQAEGDTFFPVLDRTLWREEKRERHEKVKDVPAYSFVDLVRK
ncbi:MAG TPA: dihydrofolate reductase, partial [Sphingomonadales bacterium]|nr:dihydrofolate reductase [Sphingomonadales bacterium]